MPTPGVASAGLLLVGALLLLRGRGGLRRVWHRRTAGLGFIAALGAVAIASCGREPTAPSAGRLPVARPVSFVASFPAGASALAGGSDIVAFAKVRVTFHHADGTMALDTIVDFASTNGDQAQVTFTLHLRQGTPSSGEPMTLSLAYVSASGDTVFRGGPTPVTVVPSSPGSPAPVVVQVPVHYSGPGSNAAAVRISPRALSVPAGDAFTLTAAATDASGTPLPATPIVWQSLDPPAAVLNSATAGSGTTKLVRGSARIVATLLTG
ncbi:MAG: hypothetical protein IT356_01895 [Gemmatimonadaceae bacterium]|nr:hypothetical protein [Gemmatimonadaceae bacterium]